MYTKEQLDELSFGENKIPLSRYLHKFENKRKELKRLKPHEKKYLFDNMSILRDCNGKYAFNLSEIKEAADRNFIRLIYIYMDNLSFDPNKPTLDQFRRLIDKQTKKEDKIYFDKQLNNWKDKVSTGKGFYISQIKLELDKKIKGYNNLDELQIDKLYIKAFLIYYKVINFFEGIPEKHMYIEIMGGKIIVDIHSYIHILFRHYYPSLDTNVGKTISLNENLPFIDMDNFPNSIITFLRRYFNKDIRPLDRNREYLLFSYKMKKYIIWIKPVGNNDEYHLDTLYKCEKDRDLDKFNGLTKYNEDSKLAFYF